ncbi:PQQ-dependent sugar dehydrogenase [Alphaproteobacteria bacterium]|nr:PQQ-dependent sugar dehydrogenase [Alphaproteobacteria bacterium]
MLAKLPVTSPFLHLTSTLPLQTSTKNTLEKHTLMKFHRLIFSAIPLIILVPFVVYTINNTSFIAHVKQFIKNESKTSSNERVLSVFFPLDLVKLYIPKNNALISGGALSSVDWNNLILMQGDGTLYIVDDHKNIKISEIELPDNGYSDLFEFADTDEGRSYVWKFSLFRYNDVHFDDSFDGGVLYVSYTFYDKQGRCFSNRVSALDISKDTLLSGLSNSLSWRLLYQAKPCLPLKEDGLALAGHMAGGRIDFDEDNKVLYLANGEYGFTDSTISQATNSDYGSIIKLNLKNGTTQKLSRGHRNVQGIAFDHDKSALWAVEHGMRGGDEINLIKKGQDYGWPKVTYGTQYNGMPLKTTSKEKLGRHEGYAKPVWSFLPSIAPGTATVARGFHKSWDGDLLVGSLRSKLLVRLRYDHLENRAIFAERIFIGSRMRDIEMMPNGKLAIWADAKSTIIFVEPSKFGASTRHLNHLMSTSGFPESITKELKVALRQCNQCHSFEPEDHSSAPSLWELKGRRVGSTSFKGYSEGLSRSRLNWEKELLMSYLSDPSGVFSGTSMPNPEVPERIMEPLIQVLEGLTSEGGMRMQNQNDIYNYDWLAN